MTREVDHKPLDSVGSFDLNFHSCFNLPELKHREYIESMNLVSINISSKFRLLLLFHEIITSPTHIKFTDFSVSRANTKTVLIVADVDWISGSLFSTQFVTFGILSPNVNLIDETSDGFVLVSSRCPFGEKNVVITNADGSVIREICFGDGICNILCFEDEVTVGYFDEGVFGNYGWDDPIGSPGLVKFDLTGRILWKNTEDSISDVYSMTIDDTGKLYFHNYTPFMVVCSSFEKGAVRCKPGIHGSEQLFVSKDGQWIVLDGGYERGDQFYAFRFSEPNEKWRIIPKLDGDELNGELIARGSKLIMVANKGTQISIMEWEGMVKID
jgi:hypothetical protein